MKPKLLFLFPDGWDEAALAAVPALRDEFDVVCEGFDLFRFPENANILWFDARRWIARLARRYRNAGVAGVASTNEQYGALLAAVAGARARPSRKRSGARSSGPSTSTTRDARFARALPEANPAFALLPYAFGRTSVATGDPGLPFPFFVKPVKAAFSVLATSVDNADELQRHLTFHPWETHIIKRLVRPFGDLMREYGSEFTVDPEHMLAEGLLDGVQINVDGWMDRGRVGFFGIVDAVMYPGTRAFQRFEYPSRLPASAQADAFALAERAMRAVGFDHGAFNIELYWQPETNRFSIIEINPRLAAQFGDLYENVDGTQSVLAPGGPVRRPHAALDARPGPLRRRRELRVPRIQRRRQDRAEQGADPTGSASATPTPRCTPSSSTATAAGARPSGSAAIATRSSISAEPSREDLERRYDEVCRNVSFERGRRRSASSRTVDCAAAGTLDRASGQRHTDRELQRGVPQQRHFSAKASPAIAHGRHDPGGKAGVVDRESCPGTRRGSRGSRPPSA